MENINYIRKQNETYKQSENTRTTKKKVEYIYQINGKNYPNLKEFVYVLRQNKKYQ